MNANGIDVFHTTNCDSVVLTIAHNLKLDLLKALYASLNENLANRRCGKCTLCNLASFFFVVSKAAACTTKSKCGTKNYGITNSCCSSNCVLNIFCNFRWNNGLTDFLAKLLKKLSVFGSFNRLGGCAEKLNATLAKDSFFLKQHRKVKTRLSADAGHDRVRALVSYNFRNIFKCQGLHIHLVRNTRVRHNGSGV